MKAEIKFQTQEDGDWILASVEYDTVEHNIVKFTI